MDKEPEFWAMEGDNHIGWRKIDDRVEAYLEECELDGEVPDMFVKVIGFNKSPAGNAVKICERIVNVKDYA